MQVAPGVSLEGDKLTLVIEVNLAELRARAVAPSLVIAPQDAASRAPGAHLARMRGW